MILDLGERSMARSSIVIEMNDSELLVGKGEDHCSGWLDICVTPLEWKWLGIMWPSAAHEVKTVPAQLTFQSRSVRAAGEVYREDDKKPNDDNQ